MTKGYCTLQEYGGSDDNSTDNTPALNAAFAAGEKDILFPFTDTGIYKFDSAPNPLPTQTSIRPGGFRNVTLMRNWDPLLSDWNFLTVDGVNHYIGAFIIETGPYASGGAVAMVSSASSGHGSFSLIDGVYITGASTWAFGLDINGLAKATGTARGCRDLTIRDAAVFQCSIAGISLAGVKNLLAAGINQVGTPTPPTAAGIIVTGNATVTSDNLDISSQHMTDIDIHYGYNVRVAASKCSAVTIHGTTSNCLVDVAESGVSISNSGTNSLVRTP